MKGEFGACLGCSAHVGIVEGDVGLLPREYVGVSFESYGLTWG